VFFSNNSTVALNDLFSGILLTHEFLFGLPKGILILEQLFYLCWDLIVKTESLPMRACGVGVVLISMLIIFLLHQQF
jgi:hypothetical protein